MARDNRYDAVKGLAIVLMVFGHACPPGLVRDFIYLFHMPVFFILAGWFYRRPDGISEAGRFVWKRVVRLWLPFVFWAGLAVGLHDWFVRIGIYTVGHFEGTVLARQGIFEIWGVERIVRQLALVPAFVGGCTGMGAPYWFIPTFFYAVVFYMISDYAVSRWMRKPVVGLTVLAVTAIVLGRYVDLKALNFFTERLGGRQMLTGYFLVHVGRILRDCDLRIDRLTAGGQAGTALLSGVLLLSLVPFGHVELVDNAFPSVLFLLVTSLTGWGLVTAAAGLPGRLAGGLSFVGQRTLPILFMHLYAFKLVSYLGVRWRGDPDWMLASPVVTYDGWAWCVGYVLAGIVLPLAADWLWGSMRTRFARKGQES